MEVSGFEPRGFCSHDCCSFLSLPNQLRGHIWSQQKQDSFSCFLLPNQYWYQYGHTIGDDTSGSVKCNAMDKTVCRSALANAQRQVHKFVHTPFLLSLYRKALPPLSLLFPYPPTAIYHGQQEEREREREREKEGKWGGEGTVTSTLVRMDDEEDEGSET